MKKPADKFCSCNAADPICTDCWKPIRQCHNWIQRTDGKRQLLRLMKNIFPRLSAAEKSALSNDLMKALPKTKMS